MRGPLYRVWKKQGKRTLWIGLREFGGVISEERELDWTGAASRATLFTKEGAERVVRIYGGRMAERKEGA